MLSITEQRKELEQQMNTAERLITEQKEYIKNVKAKMRKLDKVEKELTSIFGVEETPSNVVTGEFRCEELPGQMEMENVG